MSEEFKFDNSAINLLEGLGHPYRYTIVESMINGNKPDEGFSMRELQTLTGFNVTTLHVHLKHLIEHNVVQRLSSIREGNTIGYYRITDLALRFLKTVSTI